MRTCIYTLTHFLLNTRMKLNGKQHLMQQMIWRNDAMHVVGCEYDNHAENDWAARRRACLARGRQSKPMLNTRAQKHTHTTDHAPQTPHTTYRARQAAPHAADDWAARRRACLARGRDTRQPAAPRDPPAALVGASPHPSCCSWPLVPVMVEKVVIASDMRKTRMQT